MKMLPYADYFQFNRLDQRTVYRFAEIELNNAYGQLQQMFQFYENPTSRTEDFIAKMFFGHYHTEEEAASLLTAFNSVHFRRPLKDEMIFYFLYHHQSYRQVQKMAKASPNTILAFRNKSTPIFHPVIDFWTPATLERWNRIKNSFNLFNETLVQHPANRISKVEY